MTFTEAALRYFSRQVPEGMVQRIDGIECFSDLPNFWFWRHRLNALAKRGVLSRKRTGSFWLSCDGMPAYGLPKHPINNAQ